MLMLAMIFPLVNSLWAYKILPFYFFIVAKELIADVFSSIIGYVNISYFIKWFVKIALAP